MEFLWKFLGLKAKEPERIFVHEADTFGPPKKSSGPRYRVRYDLMKATRRDSGTQTSNSIANFTESEVETNIQIPINFKPSTDRRYLEIARKRLVSLSPSKGQGKEKETRHETISATDVTRSEKIVRESIKETIKAPETNITSSAPSPDTLLEGIKKEKKQDNGDNLSLTSFTEKEKKEDPFPITNFTMAEKEKEEESDNSTFSLVNFTGPKTEKQESDDEGFALTNFSKTEESEKSSKSSSRTSSSLKSEESTSTGSETESDSESKQERGSKPEIEENKSGGEDVFSMSNFGKQERKMEEEEDVMTFRAPASEAEKRIPSIEELKAKMEAWKEKEKISSERRFTSAVESNFSRHSIRGGELGGFVFTPISIPMRRSRTRA